MLVVTTIITFAVFTKGTLESRTRRSICNVRSVSTDYSSSATVSISI